jgi:4-hydroxythreonine-4-phosphate dehydrogenase
MSNTAAKTASPSALPAIAVTSGEPAGIGPDICLRLAERSWPVRLVVIGDRELLAERAKVLGLDAGKLDICHVPLVAPCTGGLLDAKTPLTSCACSMSRLAGCRARANLPQW